jgi:hypothetical protein
MFRSYHTGRPAIALTIALGFLLQSLMPAFFATTGFASISNDQVGLATVIICSDEGFIRITLDEDGNLLETEKSATGKAAELAGKTDCPCCVLPGCKGFGAIAQVSLRGFQIAASQSYYAADDGTTTVPADLIVRARAPPQ